MEGDHSTLWFVFLGILIAFVIAGLTMVIVGEIIRRRDAEWSAWLLIGAGIVVLIVPAGALMVPPLLT